MTCSECNFEFCYICRNDYQFCTCFGSEEPYFRVLVIVLPVLFYLLLPFAIILSLPIMAVIFVFAMFTDKCDCVYVWPCMLPMLLLAFDCGCILNFIWVPFLFFAGPTFFIVYFCGNRIRARYTLRQRQKEKMEALNRGRMVNNYLYEYDRN